MYSYIQSRFYRSPEVMLGLPYTVAGYLNGYGSVLTEGGANQLINGTRPALTNEQATWEPLCDFLTATGDHALDAAKKNNVRGAMCCPFPIPHVEKSAGFSETLDGDLEP